jgi:stage V sporulation protein SpoVS
MSDAVDGAPSDRARELVRGAFDLHVHVAPDVIARRIDDVSLARRFRELGLAGFALKSHYVPTAERAAVVRAAVPEVDAIGAVALNRAVGGLNPLAVEIAAREGARIVWLPTVDAPGETAGRTPRPDAKVPPWAVMQQELLGMGMAIEPVPVLDDRGRPLEEACAVLEVVARHDMVLATGHLGRNEIFAMVEAAFQQGVRQVVVTHPEFPSQNLSIDDQRELASRGALLERCFTTPYTGKCSWERWLEATRAVGAENSILSTDLGQRGNPPVEDGLALMADRLLLAGFSDADVHTMAVENTRRVAGAAPVAA